MSDAVFPIPTGGTVTAFALGPLTQTVFRGAVRRGVDNVDYKFINGFVDVGDLPCRIAVRNDVASRPVPTLTPFEVTAVNLPGFNRRLDFSSFWHIPTHLARWARTTLKPQADGDHRFRIGTCGGVHIWVDGAHAASFEPYTRNAMQEREVVLPLRASGSDVVILIEDMAERDTNYFLELTWLGQGGLQAVLPVAADASDIALLMSLARSVHPAQVCFDGSGPLKLAFEAPAAKDVRITARIRQSVHLNHLPPLMDETVVLRAGATSVEIGGIVNLPDAYHPLDLVFVIGASRVERHIGFALLRQTSPQDIGLDLPTRKAKALAFAAKHGEPRIGRVLAQYESGLGPDAVTDRAIADTLAGINDRRDCSDFVMVPLLWLYALHHDKLAAADDIRQAILGYRYWMDEPGNDAMWFWSENHVLCFHVSEYIAGGLFPDEVFINSGMTGREHRALAEKRLDRWFASVEDHGLAEWNSAAYYPVDFIGLMALQRWATGDLKRRTEAVLDALMTMIALHTAGGVSAGSMGRAYDKELRAGPLSELAPFAAVAFGKGWLNDGVASLPMFCASDYVPPEAVSTYAALPEGQALTARYTQGYATAARLSLFKTAHVQLSAAIDAPAGRTGHQQHLVDWQSASDPFARVWVNHPGEDDPWGHNRPSYWAGNGIMPRVGMADNTVLFLSDLGTAPRLPFTHAYAPLARFDEVLRGDDWMALRSGQGYVLLQATGAIASVTQGPGAGIEHRVNGTLTGWAITTGDLHGPLADLPRHPLRLTGRTLHWNDLTLDDVTGLQKGGVPQPFGTDALLPHVRWIENFR